MAAINPLTDLSVGIVPLKEVLGQPGVEFLKGISAGRYPMPPMAAVIPVAPLEVEVGRVVFRAVPEERFYDPIGSVHGGYASTLLDTAMGCAVHSTLEAGILSRGARVGSAEGRLTDSKGDLLASGTTTCLIFSVAAAASTQTPPTQGAPR